MADNATLGAPGLLFPFVLHSIEGGILQDSKDMEGGFALWGKKGEPGKVWAARPQVADGASGTKDDPDSFLAGLCQRTTVSGGYDEGDAVNVVKKGRIWVKVKGAVTSGADAYVGADGLPTASSTSTTAISGGKFKSNATDGQLAELEIG